MVCKNKVAIDSRVPPFRFHVEDIGFPIVSESGFFQRHSHAVRMINIPETDRNGPERPHLKRAHDQAGSVQNSIQLPLGFDLGEQKTLDSWVSRNSRGDLYNLRELQLEQNFISKISDIQKISQFGKNLLNPKISATKIWN